MRKKARETTVSISHVESIRYGWPIKNIMSNFLIRGGLSRLF